MTVLGIPFSPAVILALMMTPRYLNMDKDNLANSSFQSPNGTTENAMLLSHIGVLMAGFIAGLVAAYGFSFIQIDFSGELLEARRLGIVSLTIINNYPKSKDMLTYVTVLGFPVIFSAGFWLMWARRVGTRPLTDLYGEGRNDILFTNARRAALAAVILLYVAVMYGTIFHSRGYESSFGSHVLLSEEGFHLYAVQRILSGDVIGRDFTYYYGPMLIYPLVWAMKIFGVSVLTERFYTYLLEGIAYGIVIIFLYRTIRSKMMLLLASVIFLAIYLPNITAGPLIAVGPHNAYLRVAFGFLPILLLYLFLGKSGMWLPFLTGLLAGQDFLFSQEFAVCCLLALLTYFVLYYLLRHDYAGLVKNSSAFISGCLLSVIPMLCYLYSKGALAPIIKMLYQYPRFFSLGYFALPFPNFASFVKSPVGSGAFVYYWVIFVYSISAVSLFPVFYLGKHNDRHILKAALVIYGIFLYRYALGRSDEHHVIYAAQAAFLLVFLSVDEAFLGISRHGSLVRKGASLSLLFALVVTTSVTLFSSGLKSSMKTGVAQLTHSVRTGHKIPGAERANIEMDSSVADSFLTIKRFLDSRTRPGDYVYFYPHELAYYFLLDRRDPTKGESKATKEQRREVVSDLESKKPEYVIYSKNTWYGDLIDTRLLLPEIATYLAEKYRPVLDKGNVLIAERRR